MTLATLGRLWAVARLTLLEAVRRKVFVLLFLFGATVVSSAAFFPAIDLESRLRLIEVWSVRASLLFSVIVAIFLAGFSLPNDFETRRVYTLVSKPLHKMTYFGGRLLGFILLLALFLGSMALISMAYIRVVAWMSGPQFPALKAEPRFFAAEFVGDGDYVRAEDSDRLGVIGSRGMLVWKIRGLHRNSFDETMRLHLRANLGRLGKDFAIEGGVVAQVVNPATGERVEQRIDAFHTNQEYPLEVPSALITPEGTLQVALYGGEPDLTLDASSDGVVLYGRSLNFELNYVKGMVLVLFQSTVVLAVTLASSTFLTAPVSIVLGIVMYMIGMMWGNIAEGVRDIDIQMTQFRSMLAQGKPQQARTPENLPPWVLEASTTVSRIALKLIPDFSQFNFSDYLLRDHAVMGRDLLGGFLSMLPRVAVLVLIGLIAMLFRDFSS